jgi:hypothetical protein
MATILVPTDYATIALAVAAASNGDTLMLEDGDHAVTSAISTPRAYIRVLAQNPGQASITPTTSTFGTSALTRWEFHDVVFMMTSTTASVTTSYSQASYFRCTFDHRQRAGNSGTATINLTAGSTANLKTFVRDCTFLNNETYTTGRAIYVQCSSANVATLTIEGNRFVNYRGVSSSQAIRLWSGLAGSSSIRIRNNTFVNTTFTSAGSSYIGVSASTTGAGTFLMQNNVFEGTAGTTCPDINSTGSGAGYWTVSHNSRYPTNTPGSFINGSPTNSDNETSDIPLLDALYLPLDGGLAYRNGTAGPLKDSARNSYETVPSRGCLENKGHAGRLTNHWIRIPFLSGLSLDLGTPIVFPASDYETFEGALDVTLAVTRLVAMHAATADAGHGWECWYDGTYRAQAGTAYDLSTAGVAATLLGSYTGVAETSSTLSQDPYTMDTPYLIDEDVLGEESRAQIEKTAVGRPYAAVYPADSRRWMHKFTVVSPAEDVRQIGRTAAERVVEAYLRGTPLRVYRRIDNVDPWSTTNTEGYSDIIMQSTTDNVQHQWYDAIRTRFELEIEGVEIR